MKLVKRCVLATGLLVLGAALAAGAAAQTTSKPPANLPPAGFTGAQYVDNNGCIYIRAGTSGAVTWVPRITRDRRPLCGYQPSFPSPRTTVAAAPAAPEVTVIGGAPGQTSPSQVVPSPNATAVAVTGGQVVITPQTRILPRHLYEQRKNLGPVKTPRGYRPAWNDGRLNPRRAEQTLQGQAEMRRFWTDTVPRRLVD